ncbi:site-specific DNA-methyltransferase [Paenibacillus kyungheensis]
MKKLKMMSPNCVEQNVEKIAQWMPNIITETLDAEGNLKKAIDFELLKQELSEVIVEGDKERYQLTWPGKKEAIINANTPINKTLRPIKEDSIDWDTTQNLYIEGDNLEVMKLLQESYLNKVKCIYIDPPYNTGNDFVYNDNYSQNSSEYFEESGQVDEDNNWLQRNKETDGRFHSDWLTMMYSRLRIARNLLKNDGIIFISIDDNEVDNLRKICNEIFGSNNFIANIVWQRAFAPKNDSKYFSVSHEYILAYTRNIDFFDINLLPRSDEANSRYKNFDKDSRGLWTSDNLTVKTYSKKYDYPIITPSGRIVNPSHGSCWRVSKNKFKELVDDNRIWFGEKGENVPRLKRFLSEVQNGMVPITLWLHQDVGHNQEGRQELKKIFDNQGYFDGPKPTRLLKKLIKIANCKKNDIVMDFFSGSSSTADAVLNINSQENMSIKFIMVQIPEEIQNTNSAYQAGYKNICEIGKERIRRAAQKIKAETSADIDYGFRVYRLDSSNMKDVYYTPNELGQIEFEDLLDNIKEDRTCEDLLTQVILSCGLELSLPMETKQLDHYKIHYVNDTELIACFDENITDEVFELIANEQPEQVVFRDHSFKDDSTRINITELFDTLSHNTKIRVL